MTFDSMVVQNTCQLFQIKLVAVTINLIFRDLFKFLPHPPNAPRDFMLHYGNDAPDQNVLGYWLLILKRIIL